MRVAPGAPGRVARRYKRDRRRQGIVLGMDVTGKRILVTGGTSGVGEALVRLLAEHGASVATCGRRGGEGGAPGVVRVAADLAVPGQAARVVAAAVDALGGLDVVVANAGVQHPGSLVGGPVAEEAPTGDPSPTASATGGTQAALLARAGQEIAVNLTSVVELAVACWPHLAAHGSPAAFLAVTSALAYAPKQSAPVYCATKSGVRTLLRALRYQAEADTPAVKVQEIVLPLVATAMTTGRDGLARTITAEQAAVAMLRGIQTGRPVVAVGAARALLTVHRLHPPTAYRLLRRS